MNLHGLKAIDRSDKTTAMRHLWFFLSLVMASILAMPPLTFFGISFRSDYYSHFPLIPLISAYLLYQRRKTVFDHTEYEPRCGLPVAAVGLLLYAAGIWGPAFDQHGASSLMVFSSLLFLFGSFALFYGRRAFRQSAFPFLFLLFMVPLPSALMDRIIYFLQAGSAEVTDMIFTATGIPYLREGFVFHLPGFSIEVAKVCSGIRSSLALVITSVLAAHFFLQAYWQKAVLAVSLLPIVLVKNGIRISVLTFLAIYVDQGILINGFLHKSGGIFFFIPALAFMGIILWLLRKMRFHRQEAKYVESTKLAGSMQPTMRKAQSAKRIEHSA